VSVHGSDEIEVPDINASISRLRSAYRAARV
jgi:hypothetical protein